MNSLEQHKSFECGEVPGLCPAECAAHTDTAGTRETGAGQGECPGREEAPGLCPVSMVVNEQPVTLLVDPRESLLDTLRSRLRLTSVKRGCEVGECGACTVLVDGEAIDSCIYLTMWAQGKHILTVEGLRGPSGELSPIQRAFVEEAAVQCGFCTPGLIMSAVEIVGSGRRYTRQELRKLISGHLCRCTGYQNILNAMERIVDEACRYTGGIR